MFGISALNIIKMDPSLGTAYMNVWASKNSQLTQTKTASLGQLSAGTFDLSTEPLAHVNVTALPGDKVQAGFVLLTATSREQATSGVSGGQAILGALAANGSSAWDAFGQDPSVLPPVTASACSGFLAADEIGPMPMQQWGNASQLMREYAVKTNQGCQGSDLQVGLYTSLSGGAQSS